MYEDELTDDELLERLRKVEGVLPTGNSVSLITVINGVASLSTVRLSDLDKKSSDSIGEVGFELGMAMDRMGTKALESYNERFN